MKTQNPTTVNSSEVEKYVKLIQETMKSYSLTHEQAVYLLHTMELKRQNDLYEKLQHESNESITEVAESIRLASIALKPEQGK